MNRSGIFGDSTPLHVAALRGDIIKVVRTLMAAGYAQQGRTAHDCYEWQDTISRAAEVAKEHGNIHVMNVLRQSS